MAATRILVRVALGRSSSRFLDAFEHADRALLEDEIAEAHAELKAELQGLRFESGSES